MDLLSLPEIPQEEEEKPKHIELDYPDIYFTPNIKTFQEFSKTTALAEKILDLNQYKEIQKQVFNEQKINKKKISIEEIITTATTFLHSDSLTFLEKSQILMSFAPAENAMMQYIFLNFSEENSTFLENWQIFSFAVHYIIKPQNICYAQQLEQLDKLLKETEIYPSFDSTKSIFSEIDKDSFNMKRANLFEKTITNYSQLFQEHFSENSEIMIAYSSFAEIIQRIISQIKFLDYVSSIDQISSVMQFNFSDHITRSKKIHFIRQSLSLPLLYMTTFTDSASIQHDTIKRISTILRKIQTLSNYSPLEELIPLLAEYIDSCDLFETITTSLESIEEDISLIYDFLNARKEKFVKIYSSFQDFVSLRDKQKQMIRIKHNEMSSKFISFVSLLNQYSHKQYGMTIEIQTAIYRISKYMVARSIAESYRGDAMLFLRFCQSQTGYKPTLKDCVSAMIEATQSVLEAHLIKSPYDDFLKRLKLMFSIFRCLYDSSASHLRNSAFNFFKYFPNIFELSDFFTLNVPGHQDIHIIYEELNTDSNQDISEQVLAHENTSKEEKDDQINEIIQKEESQSKPIFTLGADDVSFNKIKNLMERIIKSNTSQKIEDVIFEKLSKILNFISVSTTFYQTYIKENAVSATKYEFVFETTDTQKQFVELIETLLPLLSFQPTSSLQLCEKTFALVLMTLYKPYAAKDVLTKGFNGVRSALFLRLPNLGFRFTSGCCYFLRKLIQRESIKNIPLEVVQNVYLHFSNIIELSDDSTPQQLYDSLMELTGHHKTKTLYSSLIYFTKSLCYLDSVSRKLIKVTQTLEIDDPLVGLLVPLSVVACSVQSIGLMYQQLTGEPICENIHKIWPFNSGQTNMIIFSELKEEDLQQIVQFIVNVHEDIPVLPRRTFVDAAHALIQECYVYANSLAIDPAIVKTISEKLGRITQISIDSESTNDFETFTTETFFELYLLSDLLESIPQTYAVQTALDDIKNFRRMILEYITFSHLKIVFQSCWKALAKLPKPFKPDMPENLKFIEKKPADFVDSIESYSFTEPLKKLKESFKDVKNEEINQSIQSLSKLLNHPKINVDLVKIDEQIQRFIARTQTANQRIELKIEEIQKEKERIKNKQTTLIFQEAENLRSKINEIKAQISSLNKEKNRKENQLNSLKEEIENLINKFKQLKQEIGLSSTLPDDVSVKDIEDSEEETSKSQPAQKSADLIDFTKSIKDQNMKLRAAIQRASIIKKVPGLKRKNTPDQEKVLLELIKKRDQLKEDVKNLETITSGISTNDLFDIAGFSPLSVPEEVKQFIEMADKMRAGRDKEVNYLEFQSGLDSTEKFIYELSQNRRDFVAFVNSPAAAELEEDIQEQDVDV